MVASDCDLPKISLSVLQYQSEQSLLQPLQVPTAYLSNVLRESQYKRFENNTTKISIWNKESHNELDRALWDWNPEIVSNNDRLKTVLVIITLRQYAE